MKNIRSYLNFSFLFYNHYFMNRKSIFTSKNLNKSLRLNLSFGLFSPFLAILVLTIVSPIAKAHVVINEIMQSNIDCIMDDLNEFPDSWVELYNPDVQVALLTEYSIGTSEDANVAYPLSGSLSLAQHIVVFCDKADQGHHTNFRLDSGKGCSVYLFHNGEIVDKVVNLKKQPAANISYGRISDFSEDWGYQDQPTPGAKNCGRICQDVLPDPVFSVPGRVSSKVFDLILSLPKDAPTDAVIRYTLDGSEPINSSSLYSGPINVSGSMTIRAKLFCDGYLSPRSITHSYIFHPQDMTIPIISLVTDNDYFYDEKIGIYVEGSYSSWMNNYSYDWRRPVNVEYFVSNESESVINQLCETRVKGGATRFYPLKSLVLYANKRFGTKRLNYEFFPDQTPGIMEFKSIELRNAGNDYGSTYMRDGVIQKSMGMNCDLDWQASRPVVLYINGIYKGVINIRPRSNEDYVYSYYDGLEDIDMLENWWELKSGTYDNFFSFKNFYSEEGHYLEEYEEFMDIGEFCNLMIMNLFFDNKDFPANNIVMWRPISESGRWRWIAKDTDFGLGYARMRPDYPTLDWIVTPGFDGGSLNGANNETSTRLFRRLLNIPEFKKMFIDRCGVYLGDFLKIDSIIGCIDSRYDELKGEMDSHCTLLHPQGLDYESELNWVREWVRQRHNFFYTYLSEFFGLESPVSLLIHSGEGSCLRLIVNDIPMRSDEFDGYFYPDQKLVIKSDSESDSFFVRGWMVKVYTGDSVSTMVYDTEILSIDMPFGDMVEISPITSADPFEVEEVSDAFESNSPCDVFDISGRFIGSYVLSTLSELSPGLYVVRQGKVSKKLTIK